MSDVVPRTEVKDRFYRVFTYQPVDRVPDIEFGYWPQTIRRWLEGGPAGGVRIREEPDVQREAGRVLRLRERRRPHRPARWR